MAASSSSSQVRSVKYEIFISFRGADVRYDLLSHLVKELRQENIEVFVDDNLERGEEISSSLVKAIEGSKIALVIFSKDYASSRWCLEELVKIMERKASDQQIVIPVFYHVDPSDVRHQRHTYAEAFKLHEEKFKDKVEIWRSVLAKSSNLSGHHSSQFQNASELVDAIVKNVVKKLEDNCPIMPERQLIGFHRNFTKIESFMEIKSQEVRMLGIWGMGGIGKSTLTSAIFDKFLSKFESHCLLADVRKSVESFGLSYVREELLSKLLDQKGPINMNDAMTWLQRKKVLIGLDDVDDPKQVKDLVRPLNLGSGSRVIVTSRDKHVLLSGGIVKKYIHEVQELSSKESLELFCAHAFDQSHPNMDYQELSVKTVALAGGIPLALEVLGSHFHSRDKKYWESELSKLKKCPHQKIQNILKISYDGLDDEDKKIFLDIAYFFVGEQRDPTTQVLDAYSGIQNLIDKSLVKISRRNIIVMHDLIREMAEQIVCKNSQGRSRVKDDGEIFDILESNMGTGEIEGIMLKSRERKYPPLEGDFFKKLKKLRILKILVPIDLPRGLDSFPDKLRYLHWDDYPSPCLPPSAYLENLIKLQMTNSNVKKLWDGKQDLANLKEINLKLSKQLMELPDLSKAHKLKIVNLSFCENLRSVHPSILSLHTVVRMYVSYCKNLESLESETHLKSLSTLGVDGCLSLKRFWLSAEKLRDIHLGSSSLEILRLPTGCFTELRKLTFNGERLSSLPIDELCWLTNLERFEVCSFKQDIETMELHSLFDAWRNLTELSLKGWSKLSEIPDNIKGLTRLFELSLDDSGVETLPACINNLSRLRFINLKRCKRLKSILGLPPSLQALHAEDCTSLETVSSESPFKICAFNFDNCVKLDESSLRFIEEELAYSSAHHVLTSLFQCHVCYPGSRVPKWMKYKQMTKASPNTIQFTNDKASPGTLVLCCIAPPHLMSKTLRGIFCDVTYDDNEFRSQYSYGDLELITDDVLIWFERWGVYGNIPCEFFLKCWGNISCEFFLKYWD